MKDRADHNATKDATNTTTEEQIGHATATRIILAIDVGSSSVRCTAYEYGHSATTSSEGDGDGDGDGDEKIATIPIPRCSSSIQRQGVEPISGAIRTNDLLDAVDCSVDEVLAKLGERSRDQLQNFRDFRVEAVGFSTFVMNMVAVDDTGELVALFGGNSTDRDKTTNHPETNGAATPTTTISVSYACNTPEVNKECQRLRQELGQEELDKLYQATGAPLHSAYALAQLRVLYETLDRTNPQTAQKIRKWQSLAGYCASKWTGRPHFPISYSEASWTGLLNVCDCTYETSALNLLPPECRAALPELADITQYRSGIPRFHSTEHHGGNKKTNPYWEKWPQLRATKIFPGIGDGACANVGSKCTTISRIAVTVGTSAAARMCLRHEASASGTETGSGSGSQPSCFSIPECRGLFCYRIDRNHLLIGGALTDGGSVVEWASRFLNLDKDRRAFRECLEETRGLVEAELDTESRAATTTTMQKDHHRDLTMVPFLSGERSTGFRDGAAGAVFGLTRETTPAHFLKASLEGVSLRLKAVLDLLLRLLVHHDERKISRDSDGDGDRDRDSGVKRNGGDDAGAKLGVEIRSAQIPVIVASGKALEANPVWRRMIADSSGLRVVLDEDTAEGTSRGVARLVAMSLWTSETSGAVGGESTPPASSDDADRELRSVTPSTEAASPKNPQQSLDYERHQEELNLYHISKPRPHATAKYAKKLQAQEGFIDSIAPFFSSP